MKGADQGLPVAGNVTGRAVVQADSHFRRGGGLDARLETHGRERIAETRQRISPDMPGVGEFEPDLVSLGLDRFGIDRASVDRPGEPIAQFGVVVGSWPPGLAVGSTAQRSLGLPRPRRSSSRSTRPDRTHAFEVLPDAVRVTSEAFREFVGGSRSPDLAQHIEQFGTSEL